MQDSDTERTRMERVKALTFRTDSLTCAYAPYGYRIGITVNSKNESYIYCHGESKDGFPCRDDCPYYVEISMLAMNGGEN